MKYYPSVEKFYGGKIKLHTFDKLDGSNLRAEWSKKRGWYKFGTRSRLFDETDEVFGEAIEIFNSKLNEPFSKICADNKWMHAVVFMEFVGKESFAGLHIKEDPKELIIFDASIDKKGFLPPKIFLKNFESYSAKYLGEFNWTRDFFEKIRNNEIEGITFEGVVGKTFDKRLIMYKIKTQKWIDKVKEKFDIATAERIINS